MTKKSGKVTINEIASAVGVSKTTVSRYLNGKTELMSKKTAERIKAVIELSDYHPSEFARTLKSHKTKMIGVVIADIESPWSATVIASCGEELKKNGYTALFFNSGDDIKTESETVKTLVRRDMDGIIINTSSYENNYLMDSAIGTMPVVLCDRYIKNYNFDIATFESDNSMELLISHLKSEGFNRIAIFSQEWKTNSSRFRKINACSAAMNHIFGYFNEKDIYVVDIGDVYKTSKQIEDFLSTVKCGERPVIICVNAMTTLRVFNCLMREKYSVPGDVGLCGYDDWGWDEAISWPQILYPAVTAIRIDAKKVGKKCAELMLDRLKHLDKEVTEVKIPCILDIRQSTSLKNKK